MARNRGDIKSLVVLNTGRADKTALMDSLCNSALKLAVSRHAFKDSLSMPADFTITEDSISVDISSITPIVHIVTARIVEADGTKNWPLVMKSRTWWDKFIVNAEDNQKGDPSFGMRWGTNVLLNRPANSGLELRLRVSTTPIFVNDDTECPIEVLDLFIERYVTAYVFMSLQETEAFFVWKRDALGPDFDRGIVGGDLLSAVNADKYDIAEEHKVEPHAGTVADNGIAVKNLITGHPRYGETDSWY